MEDHVGSQSFKQPAETHRVLVERPAVKWPDTFEKFPLFVNYPYLLPCALASCITFTGKLSVVEISRVLMRLGGILSLFLGRDGGSREGAIRLPEKNSSRPSVQEESRPPSPDTEAVEHQSILGSLKDKISGYFSRHKPDAGDSSFYTPAVPLSTSSTRAFARTSKANGSAYGYSGSRARLANNATPKRRRPNMNNSTRRRSGNNLSGAPPSEGGELNFAQRLLMANEHAVTNIADLWVAAAMNVDNEDPFESDADESDDQNPPDQEELWENDTGSTSTSPTARRINVNLSDNAIRPSEPSNSYAGVPQNRTPSLNHPNDGTPRLRRQSSNLNIPAIFSHAGVRTPTAVLDAQELLNRPDQLSLGATPAMTGEAQLDPQALEKPPSITSQLPVMVIAQYGLLALHSTTHDQIFMSYLVS